MGGTIDPSPDEVYADPSVLRVIAHHDLRGEGKSIRAIATERGVHRNRVHRALTQIPADESAESLASGIFVGREREMAGLAAALDEAASGQGRLVMLTGDALQVIGTAPSDRRPRGSTFRTAAIRV